VVATIYQIYQIKTSKMLVHFTLTTSVVVLVDDCMSLECFFYFARIEGEHAY